MKTYGKFIFLLSLITPTILGAARYSCQTPKESHRQVLAQGNLSFTDQVVHGQRILKNVKAEIITDWDWNLWGDNVPHLSDWEYWGKFSFDKIEENTNYRPRRYLNHSQFRNFNAQESSHGMWGNLILEKPNGEERIKAHYIFQSGDHIGGVIDFSCQKTSSL